MATPQQPPGGWQARQLVAARYKVLELVQDSVAVQLYRLQDTFRERCVLAMRPSPRLMASPEAAHWFQQFAQRTLSVPPHPNVLTGEAIESDGEVPFLVLPDIDARDWDWEIAHGRPAELAQMLDVAAQVAKGLAWIHKHGVIHHNLKPANVFICSTGVVKVWKFGQEGAKTRAYASPEQLAGRSPLTPATDAWSWAASVLHMFMGTVAWQSGAEAPGALQRYLKGTVATRRKVLMPRPLSDILRQCFRTDPSRRLSAMDQIADAVRAIRP